MNDTIAIIIQSRILHFFHLGAIRLFPKLYVLSRGHSPPSYVERAAAAAPDHRLGSSYDMGL